MSRIMSRRRERAERTEAMWARANDLARFHILWEVYIFGARYGGIYEGANWLAWLGEPSWLDHHMANDLECDAFFIDYKNAPIGRGSSPNEALANLRSICVAGRDKFVSFSRHDDYWGL